MSSRASLLDLHGTCDRFSEDIFTASPVDGRDFHAAERKLVDCLPSTWRLIELSPIAPLGSNTQLTGLSQFTIAHAARDAEVLPDAVIPLSVYATSLARNLDDIVTMAASHRELRMQPHTTPGFSKHFRAFSIASVSRESAHHSRKRGALRDQVSYWFTVLATLAPGVPVRIEFSYAPVAKALMETLGGTQEDAQAHTRTGQPSPIKDRHSTMQLELDADPNSLLAEVRIDSAVSIPEWYREEAIAISEACQTSCIWDLSRVAGWGYYNGACYKLSVRVRDDWVAVVDGGFSAWARSIARDRSFICLTGGLGTEHLLKVVSDNL